MALGQKTCSAVGWGAVTWAVLMVATEDDLERLTGPVPGPVPFNYIKGNDFRVIHVDGAIGSVTPRGLIHAALYSERMPIPRLMVHPVGLDGNLEPATEQEIRPGVVREVEVSLMLDRNSAESLRTWLGEQIAELDRALAAATKARGSGRQP